MFPYLTRDTTIEAYIMVKTVGTLNKKCCAISPDKMFVSQIDHSQSCCWRISTSLACLHTMTKLI